VQAHADQPPRDHEVLDAPVRREPALQLLGVDAGDEDVRVLRVEAEQLVADRAADDVRVELE
jgi:hypothetical protein